MCDFDEDSPPRVNFDSFFDAILAIFQVRMAWPNPNHNPNANPNPNPNP